MRIEGKTQNPNVPFGSCFFVTDVWEVQPLDSSCLLTYFFIHIALSVYMKIDFVKSTFFKGKISSATIETYKIFCDSWIREVRRRGLNIPSGGVPVSKHDVRSSVVAAAEKQRSRTELQHNIEKAYEVRLNAPAVATGSLDAFWKDTQSLLRGNWHFVVIILLAYLVYFQFRYIMGINDRLSSLERNVQFLVVNNPHYKGNFSVSPGVAHN